MYRRLTTAVALLGMTLVLGGCQANREMKAEIVNIKNTSKKQFNLLKQQNEFMNRKVNTLNEKIDELTKMNSKLSEELATYASRPDEVKIEIVEEVNTRFQAIASKQEEFRTQLLADIEADRSATAEKIDTEFTEMREVLNHHTSFVQFVATEQDSINRVFANRMESRPWYQSIIGKWEDKERQAATP